MRTKLLSVLSLALLTSCTADGLYASYIYKTSTEAAAALQSVTFLDRSSYREGRGILLGDVGSSETKYILKGRTTATHKEAADLVFKADITIAYTVTFDDFILRVDSYTVDSFDPTERSFKKYGDMGYILNDDGSADTYVAEGYLWASAGYPAAEIRFMFVGVEEIPASFDGQKELEDVVNCFEFFAFGREQWPTLARKR